MINYSLVARPNPQDRDADPKFYATPQVTEKLSLAEFSRHIASHGSVYSRADIQAVIMQMVIPLWTSATLTLRKTTCNSLIHHRLHRLTQINSLLSF